MSDAFDAVIVGAGHNGLVAAADLARAGWSVCVLERQSALGGCVVSEELTRPGFVHDTLSAFHPLFHLSDAYADLAGELADHGLAYCNTNAWTTATAGRDSVAVAHRDPAETAKLLAPVDARVYRAEIERFGRHADALGTLMGTELHRPGVVRPLARLARQLGPRGLSRFAAEVSASARSWLEGRFEQRSIADLYGPWVLHTGLAPDDAGGGFATLAIATGLHAAGMPVVAGGSSRFGAAFAGLLRAHGAHVRVGADVERILVRRGRAVGVRLTGGDVVRAHRAVVASVTPAQLYDRLLSVDDAPAWARARAARWRCNRRAGMQIHVALRRPVRWHDPRLAEVPLVHCADGLDGVALACAQAAAGLLPAEPTVACGQPHLLDPSRAPDGAAVLWLQLQEVPRRLCGDAAGEIGTGDGTWTAELSADYAARVLERIARHADRLADDVLDVVVLTPPELERRNLNLLGGDIYAGDTALDQSFLWRPVSGLGSHAAPVRGLHLCGAATHPGPGLNAASGRIVSRGLLAPRRRRLQPLRLGDGGSRLRG